MNFKRLSVTQALLSGTIPAHGVQPANYSSKHAGTHTTWCREPQVSNQDERDRHETEREGERERTALDLARVTLGRSVAGGDTRLSLLFYVLRRDVFSIKENPHRFQWILEWQT